MSILRLWKNIADKGESQLALKDAAAKADAAQGIPELIIEKKIDTGIVQKINRKLFREAEEQCESSEKAKNLKEQGIDKSFHYFLNQVKIVYAGIG